MKDIVKAMASETRNFLLIVLVITSSVVEDRR